MGEKEPISLNGDERRSSTKKKTEIRERVICERNTWGSKVIHLETIRGNTIKK